MEPSDVEFDIFVSLCVLTVSSYCVYHFLVPGRLKQVVFGYVVYNFAGAIYFWVAYSLLAGVTSDQWSVLAPIFQLGRGLADFIFCPAAFFSVLHVKFPVFGNASYFRLRTYRISIFDPNYVSMVYWSNFLVSILLDHYLMKFTGRDCYTTKAS